MIWIYNRAQDHNYYYYYYFFTKYKKNHVYSIQIICARVTYIIGNTQVYDSVMADVMKKIATQTRKNMSTH